MSSSQIAISARGLCKAYTIVHGALRRPTFRDVVMDRVRHPLKRNHRETFWALRDVSFDVRCGEVMGIIGRNGAGKSTLLKILSRVTDPSGGRVEMYGRVGSLLEVGTGFHPELTGRENIFLNGAILGMSRGEIRKQFDAIVDFAEVQQFIDTPVKRYSSGMYVRLAFAVAAHLEPEILIIDEVLAVGDTAFQQKCLGKMEQVASTQGRTVLFVSHNMAAVQALCSAAVLLEQGQVTEQGAPSDVIARYLSVRNGNGQTEECHNGIVRRIVMEDGDGAPATSFRIGQTIRIRLDLDTGGRSFASPSIGIGCNTLLGQRVFTVGSYFCKRELPPIAGRVSAVCRIDSPSLAPGEYSLKVALGDTMHEDIETIEDAARITVVETDVFGNGRLPSARQGLVVARSSWDILDEARKQSVG